jgi:hypothetical protein
MEEELQIEEVLGFMLSRSAVGKEEDDNNCLRQFSRNLNGLILPGPTPQTGINPKTNCRYQGIGTMIGWRIRHRALRRGQGSKMLGSSSTWRARLPNLRILHLPMYKSTPA